MAPFLDVEVLADREEDLNKLFALLNAEVCFDCSGDGYLENEYGVMCCDACKGLGVAA